MSVFAQFFPYHLRNQDWDTAKEQAAKPIVETLEEFAPLNPTVGLQAWGGDAT